MSSEDPASAARTLASHGSLLFMHGLSWKQKEFGKGRGTWDGTHPGRQTSKAGDNPGIWYGLSPSTPHRLSNITQRPQWTLSLPYASTLPATGSRDEPEATRNPTDRGLQAPHPLRVLVFLTLQSRQMASNNSLVVCTSPHGCPRF